MKSIDAKLSSKQAISLTEILKSRFEQHMVRHNGMKWSEVQARLDSQPAKLWSLNEMESSGGEPDVIGFDKASGEFLYCDCAPESPKGRRSICYDDDALESRKEHKPKASAIGLAQAMGIRILSEAEYRRLQDLGDFDTKTSSWVQTPDAIRERGGALFCDRRYDHVFTYHNGAESYYAARGFRGMLRV